MASGPDGGNGWYQAGNLASIGIQMVVAILLGLLLGKFLGNLAGYPALGVIVGIFWGVCAGFLNLYREVKKLDEAPKPPGGA